MMGQQLSFAILYIWCKKEPMERIQFMFGFIVNSKLQVELKLIKIFRCIFTMGYYGLDTINRW